MSLVPSPNSCATLLNRACDLSAACSNNGYNRAGSSSLAVEPHELCQRWAFVADCFSEMKILLKAPFHSRVHSSRIDGALFRLDQGALPSRTLMIVRSQKCDCSLPCRMCLILPFSLCEPPPVHGMSYLDPLVAEMYPWRYI